MEYASKMYMIAGLCWLLTAFLSFGTPTMFYSFLSIGGAMFCLSFAMKKKSQLQKIEEESENEVRRTVVMEDDSIDEQ